MHLSIRAASCFWLFSLVGWSGGTGAGPLDVAVMSDGQWRSSATEFPAWQTVAFDDSGWAVARAPYPSPVPPSVLLPGTGAQYIWHDPAAASDGTTGSSVAFFRRTLTLALPAPGVRLEAGARISVDDDYEFYVNGTRVFTNADQGFADRVDSVSFAQHLVTGTNVLAIRAVDGGLASPRDRLYERVLFDGRIQENANLVLNEVPVTPAQVTRLGNAETLKVYGLLPPILTVEAGGTVKAMTDSDATGALRLVGGQVIADAGRRVVLRGTATVVGYGEIGGIFSSEKSSRTEVDAGDLKLGSAQQMAAVTLDGMVKVAPSRLLELQSKDQSSIGGTLELDGGKVKARGTGGVADAVGALHAQAGARIAGHGEIDAEVKMRPGSELHASTGDLKLGSAQQMAAVTLDGMVKVAPSRLLELQSKDQSSIGGTLELDGGKVKARGTGGVADAVGALHAQAGARIAGHGEIDAEVKMRPGSELHASTGDLKLGSAQQMAAVTLDGMVKVAPSRLLELQSKDQSSIGGTLELDGGKVKARGTGGVADAVGALHAQAGARVAGHGEIDAEVKMRPGSELHASTGDLKLGSAQQMAAVTLDGMVKVAPSRLLELQSKDQSSIGGTLELDGGKVKARGTGGVADAVGALHAQAGARVAGHGEIDAEVKMRPGSELHASTGDLKLGSAQQMAAVTLDGMVKVAPSRLLELQSKDQSSIGGTLELDGGKVKARGTGGVADAVGALHAQAGARVAGHGEIDAEVKMRPGSELHASTGDLKLGSAQQMAAVTLDGMVKVAPSRLLELQSKDQSSIGGTLELDGGKVKARGTGGVADAVGALHAQAGARVAGHGEIDAEVKMRPGSELHASTGDLKLGSAQQMAAVTLDGMVKVAPSRLLELQSKDQSSIGGTLELDGGKVKARGTGGVADAVGALHAQAGARIAGHGEIDAEVKMRPGSELHASTGDLKLGSAQQMAAVTLDGMVKVAPSRLLELQSKDQSSIGGTLELDGGKVKARGTGGVADAVGALHAQAGARIAGHGEIDAAFNMIRGSTLSVLGGDLLIGEQALTTAFDLGGVITVDRKRLLEFQSQAKQALAILRGTVELEKESTMRVARLVGAGLVTPHDSGIELLATSSAILAGSGTIEASVHNQGEIHPGGSVGTLTIGDDLDLAATSKLEFEIARDASTSENGLANDQLVVNSTLDMGGTIEIVLFDSYSPLPGEFYDLAIAKHIEGAPDLVRAVGANRPLKLDYWITDLADGSQIFRLAITNEEIPTPGTLAIFAPWAFLLLRRCCSQQQSRLRQSASCGTL